MARYSVRVWVPAEVEVEEIYSSYDEAYSIVESLSAMQPENIYHIIDLDTEEGYDEDYL